MMNSRIIDPAPPSSAGGVFAVLRARFSSRLMLLFVAGVVIAAGLVLNWSWLVAAGVTPLLLSALPCVAMCALGLCMMQMKRRGTPAGRLSDPSATNSAPSARADGNGMPEAPGSGDATFKAE